MGRQGEKRDDDAEDPGVSQLTELETEFNPAFKREKQGPVPKTSAIGAPRDARGGPKRIADTIGFRFSARHPPQPSGTESAGNVVMPAKAGIQ